MYPKSIKGNKGKGTGLDMKAYQNVLKERRHGESNELDRKAQQHTATETLENIGSESQGPHLKFLQLAFSNRDRFDYSIFSFFCGILKILKFHRET